MNHEDLENRRKYSSWKKGQLHKDIAFRLDHVIFTRLYAQFLDMSSISRNGRLHHYA